MKERPMLFNGPTVSAIMAGKKTQTRRPVKHERSSRWTKVVPHSGGGFKATDGDPARDIQEFDSTGFLCPFGIPGDRLWVRETFFFDEEDLQNPYFKADEARPEMFSRWRPSIHMPRWASRITLEITGVRVEMVQQITDSDAILEGSLFVSKPSPSSNWGKGFGRACFRSD